VVARWPAVRWLVVHWQAVRPPSFCRIVPAEVSATARALARETSRRHFLRALVAELEGDLMLVDQDSRAIDPAISAVLVSRAIDPVTLAGPDDRATGPATSADQADPVTGPATSADRGDPATDRVTLDYLADPATGSLPRIFRAASAIARDGRIGATNTATTSAIGGRTTPATLAIGSTTRGGTTITLIGHTTQDSVTGVGPRGMA
jgi:hypothetical protein